MGRLRVLSRKEVCTILANHGFLEVRRRGSHIVRQKKLLHSHKTSATDSGFPPGADNSCEGPARMPRGGEVSEYLFETGLCLPSGTQMTEEDLERAVNIIKNCHRRNKS